MHFSRRNHGVPTSQSIQVGCYAEIEVNTAESERGAHLRVYATLPGQAAPAHLVAVYRVVEPRSIDILRALHRAMDLGSHRRTLKNPAN